MRRLVLALAATALAAGPATAQTIDSAYTELDLKACEIIAVDEIGGPTWLCPGYAGLDVWVTDADLRTAISFGPNAGEERAAGQTLSAFNNLGETIEWRVRRENGVWRPFAAIVRYHVANAEGVNEFEYLSVTRIEPGATCRVGYIDARRIPEPNLRAREMADEIAPGFECADDPIFVPDDIPR